MAEEKDNIQGEQSETPVEEKPTQAAQPQPEEKKKNKALPIIIIVLLVIAIGIGVYLMMSGSGNDEPQEIAEPSSNVIGYDSTVVTEENADSFNELFESIYGQAEEGTMALQMQVQATSSDGKTFSCYLGNSPSNTYDMFMILYLDETGEEIYRSGLIPIGGRIEEITINTEEPLEPGLHTSTLVFNQVEDDQSTIHAQVSVNLNLIVRE